MGRNERLASAVIPVARAIAWRPVAQSSHLLVPLLRPAQSHFRHFLTQHALVVAQEIGRDAARGGARRSGLLAGRLHRCPRSGARFTVVERVLELEGDPDARAEGARAGWLRQRVEDAERAGHAVIGWVRGCARVGHRLPPDDEALHLRCLPRPHQATLAVADGTGGLFAHEPKVACTFLLPFHELLDHDLDARADAPPATVLDWEGYEPAVPVIGVRPAERLRLSGPQPVAPPAAGGGILGAALGSLRGLVGGSGPPG